MHKTKWRYLAVVIAITIMFLANTVNVAFSPVFLREVEAAQNSSINESSESQPTQSSNEFGSHLQDKNKQTPQAFGNFWGLNSFDKNTHLDETKEYGDFAITGENSTELVIGVDNTRPEAYASLVDAIGKNQGKIVNTVSIKGEVIALVAEMPLNVIYSFRDEVDRSNLARYTEPNMKVQAQLAPNDPYWSLQWGPQKIEADWAWNTTIGDSSVLVAIIDTGVDYNHPDLAGNYVPLGYNWVNMDNDPIDDFGHGTHCAGIVAAVINNGVGIAGVANVSIMAEKGLDAYGSGWDDDLAKAIIHAVDQGADILSNSWGGYGESMLLHDAVQYAYNNNVLVIAAAGNDAINIELYPAGYEEVVAVTATDSYDAPASFTNFGDWVEVAAPGVDIYSTMPTYHVTMNDYGYSMNYDHMSGTSMACPNAAGVAALIWSQFPNATLDWVRAQLRYTADDLGNPGFDEYYGYGRINAKNAVEQAPPDHDLQIFDWKAPRHIQSGDIVQLNVTVLNFGANAENDVSVQLLIDGNLTNSTTIDYLANLTSTTVSLSWNPLTEATYNVTLYIVPVLGETSTENNVITIMISVRSLAGFVLFDQTRCDSINWYSSWVANLTDGGYAVDTYTAGLITLDVLADYDIFVIPQAWMSYSSDEISAIQDFVLNGGGLLVIGDDYPGIYTSLTSFAGITWNGYSAWSGYTSNITPHDVTEGVSTAYFGAPLSELFVSSPAMGLIRDGSEYGDVMLAVTEVGAGRVAAIADEQTVDDSDIGYADNFRLANNMIDWLLGVKYEHELVVRLDAPSYLVPDESSQLDIIVYNRGLNNETDVELRLLINGTMVKNETIPLLVNGTRYTMNHVWTPSVEAVYNVTAYAPPVVDENVTLNNVNTKFVSVHYPLINPVEGQYANYFMNYYDASGNLIGVGYMNFTYEYYVEPYKIYISAWQKDSSGYIYTGWMIVNTMNRLVESGNVWTGYWYPGWIETDIDIGSTINLLDGTATVNGTGIVLVGARAIDCWEISYSMYEYSYAFWYDKASGLWMRMETVDPYYMSRIELLLSDTNVPVGTQYEHDLGVTLDAQLHLQPSEASMLNATVYNLGLNNESDVEIHILINGTEVASETLTNLVNGTWYTINYSWTPTAEGTYNITAYTPPALDENVTLNNIASKMVRVRYIEVALISDHSELLVIASILDSMGIGYDIYNDNSMHLYTENLNLLLNYTTVIFCNYDRQITSVEHSTLESYLAAGGNLLVTGYDSLGHPSDPLLADIVRSSSTGDNTGESDLYVVDDAHPIMDGPYGSFPAGYHIYSLFSDCDRAEADTARNAVTVAELADGYDKIIATEGLPGKVVFWNGVGPNDWTGNIDCQTMFKNLIQWFTVRYQHELIVSLQAPIFLEPSDSAMLNATVQNAGLNAEADVNVQILINSTLVENVTIPVLANGTSQTVNHLWIPTIAGKYNITVYTPPVPDENVTLNNIASKMVRVRYIEVALISDYSELLAIAPILDSMGVGYETYNDNSVYLYTENLSLLLNYKAVIFCTGSRWITSNEYSALEAYLSSGGSLLVTGFDCLVSDTLLASLVRSSSNGDNMGEYELIVVDATHPIMDGPYGSFPAGYHIYSLFSDCDMAEADTARNAVTVAELADGYDRIIATEGLPGKVVFWNGVGPNDWTGNIDCQTMFKNLIDWFTVRCITLSINLSGGSPGTEVSVSGTKATANDKVSIYWDGMFVANTTANDVGDFTYLLTVPSNATIGIHEIMALDTATGRTASEAFRVLVITLNPSIGPVGTKVTVNGAGFTPESQATITFNDMLIGYALVDNIGNFTFTFNIPFSTAETQLIKAYNTEGYGSATFTVKDITQLDVQIDVGEMHFRGEIVEFYAQTTFKGTAVNATITSAVLYKPDGTTENVLAQLVTTGLYKLSYTIPADASTGTYTLVIAAEYVTDTVQASGTSFKCFLISPTLTYTNAYVVEIRENIATVVIPDLGTIKLNLTAMNATLENIFLKVIAINSTTATIQTTIGIMNGTITSIEGNIATILVPGLGQIETDISSLKGAQETWVIPQYLILVFALIAAAGATISVILLRFRKTVETR